MSRIKSVTVKRSMVKAPVHLVCVCEDEDDFRLGWRLAEFKFDHWSFNRDKNEYFATFMRETAEPKEESEPA